MVCGPPADGTFDVVVESGVTMQYADPLRKVRFNNQLSARAEAREYNCSFMG